MKIFLSYSSHYRYVTAQIAHLLRCEGYKVWWDENLTPGKEWQEQIKEEIRNSKVFIYLLTPESIRSVYCQNEYNLAVEYGLLFIPILIHGEARRDLPDGITRQAIDFSQSDLLNAKIKLISTLESMAKASDEDLTVWRLTGNRKLTPFFIAYPLDMLAKQITDLVEEIYVEFSLPEPDSELIQKNYKQIERLQTKLREKYPNPSPEEANILGCLDANVADFRNYQSGKLASESQKDTMTTSALAVLENLSQLRWQ